MGLFIGTRRAGRDPARRRADGPRVSAAANGLQWTTNVPMSPPSTPPTPPKCKDAAELPDEMAQKDDDERHVVPQPLKHAHRTALPNAPA
jgi:hypothetical protein